MTAEILSFETGRPAEIAEGEPALVVDVGGYEGPLDLLLTLARQQKVDLSKISILALADQYLAFIEAARKIRLELAGDYLVMAAWLAYLKSRLLLPEAEGEEPSGESAPLPGDDHASNRPDEWGVPVPSAGDDDGESLEDADTIVVAPDAYSRGELLRHREFDRMTPAELRDAERLVTEAEARLKHVEAALSDPSSFAGDLHALAQEYATLKSQVDQLMERWLELAG
jgi:hypothetical protein